MSMSETPCGSGLVGANSFAVHTSTRIKANKFAPTEELPVDGTAMDALEGSRDEFRP